MKVERCVKESFVVIGKEGSTLDGEGFIQRLWVDADSHFGEVQHLAKKDENGNIGGIWGGYVRFLALIQAVGRFQQRTLSCRGRMQGGCRSPQRLDKMDYSWL